MHLRRYVGLRHCGMERCKHSLQTNIQWSRRWATDKKFLTAKKLEANVQASFLLTLL